MKTHLDWSAYDTYGMGDAYAGIPATGGNYAKAVAVCMNNQQCQREGKGVMCPSYRITHDPVHSTGARVKAFKAALNGELGDAPFLHPDLERAMDLCVSCKGCKKECPSAVDMTLIKTEFLAQKYAAHGAPRRARLFGGLPQWLHRYHGPLKAAVKWRNRSDRVESRRAVAGHLRIAGDTRAGREPFRGPPHAQAGQAGSGVSAGRYLHPLLPARRGCCGHSGAARCRLRGGRAAAG